METRGLIISTDPSAGVNAISAKQQYDHYVKVMSPFYPSLGLNRIGGVDNQRRAICLHIFKIPISDTSSKKLKDAQVRELYNKWRREVTQRTGVDPETYSTNAHSDDSINTRLLRLFLGRGIDFNPDTFDAQRNLYLKEDLGTVKEQFESLAQMDQRSRVEAGEVLKKMDAEISSTLSQIQARNARIREIKEKNDDATAADNAKRESLNKENLDVLKNIEDISKELDAISTDELLIRVRNANR